MYKDFCSFKSIIVKPVQWPTYLYIWECVLYKMYNTNIRALSKAQLSNTAELAYFDMQGIQPVSYIITEEAPTNIVI